MADDADYSLMQAQFKKATSLVNDMARRTGVNYQRWPQVSVLMENCQIDAIELASYLADGVVVEMMQMLGTARYRVESTDQGDRIASITVSVWEESITIEIINLRIKEA